MLDWSEQAEQPDPRSPNAIATCSCDRPRPTAHTKRGVGDAPVERSAPRYKQRTPTCDSAQSLFHLFTWRVLLRPARSAWDGRGAAERATGARTLPIAGGTGHGPNSASERRSTAAAHEESETSGTAWLARVREPHRPARNGATDRGRGPPWKALPVHRTAACTSPRTESCHLTGALPSLLPAHLRALLSLSSSLAPAAPSAPSPSRSPPHVSFVRGSCWPSAVCFAVSPPRVGEARFEPAAELNGHNQGRYGSRAQ
ncbi:hypothetical protein HPB47_003649 [Ixodes persulcatus]|uniref:Uncharacterized protein n=1 Tax=Ixodes persulcatus TaxID=34615 RepID=A0AC60PJ89_IXOPE|nr:hypothetical protein HPB47_003649 [Ixodes persulcatus]